MMVVTMITDIGVAKMNTVKEKLLAEFSALIDYYGGIVDYEMNMGTFWWENVNGKIYTMIVQGLDD